MGLGMSKQTEPPAPDYILIGWRSRLPALPRHDAGGVERAARDTGRRLIAQFDIYYKIPGETGPWTGIVGPWPTRAGAEQHAQNCPNWESYEIREMTGAEHE